jgi:hypothetical protein
MVGEITSTLDQFQLSVAFKASAVSKYVTEVTLGPNSKPASYADTNNRTEDTHKLSKEIRLAPSVKNHSPLERYLSNVKRGNNKNSNIETVDYTSRANMKLMYELEKQRQMKVRNAIRKRWLGMQEDS